MNIKISYSSDKPMYEQIKDGIKQAIYNGEYSNNDVLPSVRQLAKDLDVSMITTKRAYSDLEFEGFIYTVSGKGTFIKIDDFSQIKSARENELLSQFEDVINKMHKAKISKKKLQEAIEKIFGGYDNE